MSNPDGLILRYLRSIDERLERIEAELIRRRKSNIENHQHKETNHDRQTV